MLLPNYCSTEDTSEPAKLPIFFNYYYDQLFFYFLILNKIKLRFYILQII